LKRRYRLSDKERFRQVRQRGESFRHPLIVLCALPNGELFSRCGFSASRRLGSAVLRNRARRRMSEAIRLTWDLISPGWDMVWVGRLGINEANFSELQDACLQLLRRAHLLRT
jgi:ribonuclease P protein component